MVGTGGTANSEEVAMTNCATLSASKTACLAGFARLKFPDLTPTETAFLNAVSQGQVAYCGTSTNDQDASNDISGVYVKGKELTVPGFWKDPKRVIRGKLITWLCLDEEARKQITQRGIQIHGALIPDELDLSFVKLPGPLAMQHCVLQRQLDLTMAELVALSLDGSWANGICADQIVVKHSIFLRSGFRSNAEIHLVEAQIGGDLECVGGSFQKSPNSHETAIYADRMRVSGCVFLHSCCVGEVRLLDARIDGDLDCREGTFANAEDDALSAHQVNVQGRVMLNAVKVSGGVHLTRAHIQQALDCRGGDFRAATPLDLTDMSADALYDCDLDNKAKAMWPDSGQLLLDGFVYNRFYPGTQISVKERLDWLGLQPKSPFPLDSYLQLAKVLRESGDSDGALRVLVRMEDLHRSADHGPVAWCENGVLKWSIGYGYRPMWAFWEVVGLSTLGWIIYRRSHVASKMVPTDDKAYKDLKEKGKIPPHYPAFSPLVYSLENSLPLVKLGQSDKWQPDPEPRITWHLFGRAFKWPRPLHWFVWAQILLGWLLATLFLAGIAGLVHKE